VRKLFNFLGLLVAGAIVIIIMIILVLIALVIAVALFAALFGLAGRIGVPIIDWIMSL